MFTSEMPKESICSWSMMNCRSDQLRSGCSAKSASKVVARSKAFCSYDRLTVEISCRSKIRTMAKKTIAAGPTKRTANLIHSGTGLSPTIAALVLASKVPNTRLACSRCSCCPLAVDSTLGSDPFQVYGANKIRHLYGGDGRISAFIAGFGPGPLDGLLQVVGCDHAEDDRDAGVESHVSNALGDLRGDIIEVGGSAANHGPEADDPRIPAGGRHLLGDERYLERAGHPRDLDVLIPNAVPVQGVQRPVQQLVGDEIVEARDYYAKPQSLA